MSRAPTERVDAQVFVRIAMKSGAEFVCVVTPDSGDDDPRPARRP